MSELSSWTLPGIFSKVRSWGKEQARCLTLMSACCLYTARYRGRKGGRAPLLLIPSQNQESWMCGSSSESPLPLSSQVFTFPSQGCTESFLLRSAHFGLHDCWIERRLPSVAWHRRRRPFVTEGLVHLFSPSPTFSFSFSRMTVSSLPPTSAFPHPGCLPEPC